MDCKILAFELAKILLGGLQRIGQLHFTSSYLYKKMSMLFVLLWIHVSSQVGYMLKLKNVNPNGYDVVINNLHPMLLFFFQKY